MKGKEEQNYMGEVMSSRLFIIIPFLALTACGSDGVWQSARSLVQEEIFKDRSIIPHTREQIESIPYATITARLEDAVPSLMVLGYIDGKKLQWVASNNASIVTENGRLVRTVGFDQNITYVSFVDGDPLSDGRALSEKSFSYGVFVETLGNRPDAISYQCELKPDGREVITILEYTYDTLVYEEKCTSHKGEKLENKYWIDSKDGFMWRSYQKIYSTDFHLEINILKPFR